MKTASYILIGAALICSTGCDEEKGNVFERGAKKTETSIFERTEREPKDNIWFTSDSWHLDKEGQNTYLVNGISANYSTPAVIILEFRDMNDRLFHVDRIRVWLSPGKTRNIKYQFREPVGRYIMNATIDPDSIAKVD